MNIYPSTNHIRLKMAFHFSQLSCINCGEELKNWK